MSKYLAYKDVCFTSLELLKAAMADLGVTTFEVNTQPLDYYGRPTDVADLVYRKKVVIDGIGHYFYADLAFKKTEAGYIPLMDHFNERAMVGDKPFLVALRTKYSEQVIAQVAKRVRGSVHKETTGTVTKIRVRF